MAFLDYYLEVYYGENDNIKQMQKCISNFRKELRENWTLARLNTHPEIRKFNRLAEKEFGFKSFQLYISPKRIYNAYTLPIFINFKTLSRDNTMSNLIVSKNGYKFKPEANYTAYVCIFRAMLVDQRFTDREIMAIILHEIGHNFQAAISDKQASLSQANVMLFIVLIIFELMNFKTLFQGIKDLLLAPFILTNAYRQILKTIDDILYDNFKSFYHVVDAFRATLGAIAYPFNKVLDWIQLIPRYAQLPANLLLKLNPISLIITFAAGRFRGEKIADNFVTIYGYGPEIASATTKLDSGDEILQEIHIPLASPLVGLIESTYNVLMRLPDEHPAAITRVKDQSDYLKKELEKEDLDPKFKKEIMNQIKDIDKQVEKLTKINYKGAMSDYGISIHFYQLMLYKIFGGDPMDLFYRWTKDDIHQDIEDVYNRKLYEQASELTKKLNRVILK